MENVRNVLNSYANFVAGAISKRDGGIRMIFEYLAVGFYVSFSTIMEIG